MTDSERIDFLEKRVAELADERDKWRTACLAEIHNKKELATEIIRKLTKKP